MAKSNSSARDNLIQVFREDHYITQFILNGLPQFHPDSGDIVTAAHGVRAIAMPFDPRAILFFLGPYFLHVNGVRQMGFKAISRGLIDEGVTVREEENILRLIGAEKNVDQGSMTASASIVHPGCTKRVPCRKTTSGGPWRRNSREGKRNRRS
jgi:hypothetical protein